jgi:hypothetical protein
MVTHIVLLQPRPEVTAEEMQAALHHVEALQRAIPGIIDVQAGENLSANQQGYIYGFVMHFTGMEHLQAYAPHPSHRVVSDELVRLCSSIIDFDIL